MWILGLLCEIMDVGIVLVFISYDFVVVCWFVDCVLVMCVGVVVELGFVFEVLENLWYEYIR